MDLEGLVGGHISHRRANRLGFTYGLWIAHRLRLANGLWTAHHLLRLAPAPALRLAPAPALFPEPATGHFAHFVLGQDSHVCTPVGLNTLLQDVAILPKIFEYASTQSVLGVLKIKTNVQIFTVSATLESSTGQFDWQHKV